LNRNIKELPSKMKAILEALTPAAVEGFKGRCDGANLGYLSLHQIKN